MRHRKRFAKKLRPEHNKRRLLNVTHIKLNMAIRAPKNWHGLTLLSCKHITNGKTMLKKLKNGAIAG